LDWHKAIQCISGETADYDNIVQTLVSAFDHFDIVALGESHWRKVETRRTNA
jgi:hypothetical protein